MSPFRAALLTLLCYHGNYCLTLGPMGCDVTALYARGRCVCLSTVTAAIKLSAGTTWENEEPADGPIQNQKAS